MRTVVLDSWISQLLRELEGSGSVGAGAVEFLRRGRIRIGVHSQSAGARWTLDRRIELHPRYAVGSEIQPYALSLVVHEVQHLRQGFLAALSIHGELEAWQVQFRFLEALSVPPPGSAPQRALIGRLLEMPLGWNREMLSEARVLMREYAGPAYRVDLLPVYPLHLELCFKLNGRQPDASAKTER